MILHFTENEKEWLDKEPFNWHIKDGAPKGIKKSIERKLKRLKESESRGDRATA